MYQATVDWVAGAITGRIDLVQADAKAPVHVRVDISGLQPHQRHGFHVHAKPAQGAASLQQSCAACGGHFNPLNQPHGSIFVDRTKRHVGDLINNLLADATGRARVQFTDELLSLVATPERPYTVVGKSIVVHQGVDDLGQQGSIIEPPCLVHDGRIVPGKRQVGRRYAESDKRHESTVTGNAGARLACGNIRLVAAPAYRPT